MACEHVWAESKRAYTKPILTLENLEKGVRFQGNSEETANALYGFTTIEMRCGECGEIEFYISPGDLT